MFALGSGFGLVGMVRGRGWGMCYIYDSPHKYRSTRMGVCIYHGQHDLCLVQERLGEHGQVDTLRNLYCSSIQVSDNNIQLVNKTQS